MRAFERDPTNPLKKFNWAKLRNDGKMEENEVNLDKLVKRRNNSIDTTNALPKGVQNKYAQPGPQGRSLRKPASRNDDDERL